MTSATEMWRLPRLGPKHFLVPGPCGSRTSIQPVEPSPLGALTFLELPFYHVNIFNALSQL